MGSKPFQINKQDFVEIAKIMAIAGGSAALVAGLQFIGQHDFGAMGPFITAGLTAVIKALQQWSSDNSQTEPK